MLTHFTAEYHILCQESGSISLLASRLTGIYLPHFSFNITFSGQLATPSDPPLRLHSLSVFKDHLDLHIKHWQRCTSCLANFLNHQARCAANCHGKHGISTPRRDSLQRGEIYEACVYMHVCDTSEYKML